MKKFLILFCILFIRQLSAQDTIIKRNGDTVLAKVTEIIPGYIKYKRFNFPDGPSYSEQKLSIMMIKYSSGVKEVFDNDEYANELAQLKTLNQLNKKFEIRGNHYRLNGQICSEKIIVETLLETNDRKIMSMVYESKRYKHQQYIGFLAFPLGIAGLAGLVSGQEEYQALGIFSIGAAITCPILSDVFKKKRKELIGNAVKLYNQKY